MNNIKTQFSIKDLENLSGIKAHTIRIWEKRYNLLQPSRTDTNIRHYSLSSLQKLLNISFLNKNGYKISKISKIKEERIPVVVKEIAVETREEDHAINSLKLSMINFDQALFLETYDSLLKEYSFRDIFYKVFLPLLGEIGMLWQTDTITPAHEHFITSLIKQKILVSTEHILNTKPKQHQKTFVLFLPENEIHELGLMFLNYEIIRHGYQSIFLGQSIPMDCLKDFPNSIDDLVYVSYFTIKPEKGDLKKYLQDFENTLLKNTKSQFWILGQKTQEINKNNLPKSIVTHQNIDEFTAKL